VRWPLRRTERFTYRNISRAEKKRGGYYLRPLLVTGFNGGLAQPLATNKSAAPSFAVFRRVGTTHRDSEHAELEVKNPELKVMKLRTSHGAGVRGSHSLKNSKGGATSVVVLPPGKRWARQPIAQSSPTVNLCCEIFLLAFAIAVLIFFIAGLLYLLCLKHVDNLGATASRPETGLLIPSDSNRLAVHLNQAGIAYRLRLKEYAEKLPDKLFLI